jgi:cytochrome c553
MRAALCCLVGVALLASTASADPRLDYMLHCRGCHGPDGAGVAGAAPALRGEVAKFLAVPGGREYLVRVPGTAQAELDDTDVAALLNWIVRELDPANVPESFVPYDGAEVGPLRRRPLADVVAVRRDLVAAIEAEARQPEGRPPAKEGER